MGWIWFIYTFVMLLQLKWGLPHPKVARWCCITDQELSKCRDLATNYVDPNTSLTCVRGVDEEDCMSMIKNRVVDLITLGEGPLYQGVDHTLIDPGKKHGLVPVAAEFYGQEIGLGYYAVALVRNTLPAHVTFNYPRGVRTCHQAAGDIAGWDVPVGLLLKRGIIPWEECDPYVSAAKFFGDSCVPGALSPEFNKNGRNPITLCAACARKQTCPRNDSEKYFGEHGAYRCLIDSSGDVAFVTHMTVFKFTGRGNNLNPGYDFRLLCKDGSRKGVTEFRTCNLARIPARVVVSRRGYEAEHFKKFVLRMDRNLRTNSSTFRLFNSTAYGAKDVLFKDSTVKLSDVGVKSTAELWLGKEYIDILETLRSCPKQTSQSPDASPLTLTRLVLIILLFSPLIT